MSNGKKKATVIDVSDRDYKVTRIRGKDGRIRHSRSNGDAVAMAMLGMSHEALGKVMKANGLDRLKPYLDSKNPGHFRMILGQALRGMVRRDEEVIIGRNSITKLTQKVDVSKIVEQTAA